MKKQIACITILGLLTLGIHTGSADVDKDKLKNKANEQKDRDKDARDEIEKEKKKQDIKDEAEDRRDGGNAGAIVGGVAIGVLVGTVVAKKTGGKSDEAKGDASKPDEANTAAPTAGASAPLDADKDGKVSQDEFQSAMKQAFTTADKDGNGNLTREEVVAAYGEHGGTYFDALDKEKKGSLQLSTLESDAKQTFAWADSNSDGFITEDEKKAAAQQNDAAEKEEKADASKTAGRLKKLRKP